MAIAQHPVVQRPSGSTEIHLPAGGTIAGGTALDGIRAKVFADRYAMKNEQGQPIERYPEQMWARVARAIAAVEPTEDLRRTWSERFYEVLSGFKFVPGGRILSGAGTGAHVTFYNCLPPDQEVLTADGYRPIGEIEPGDEVVTHRGRLRRVLHRFERDTTEPLYIIRTKKVGFDAVRVTGEHPVLARRVGRTLDASARSDAAWIKARDLRPGDYVGIATNREERAVPVLDMAAYLRDGKYQVSEARIDKPAIRGERGRLLAGGLHFALPRRVDVDADLMYLFGVWLGDGCVTHRTRTSIASGIQISFRPDQQARLERCAAIVERVFGVRTSVSHSRRQECVWLWANSMPLGEFFEAFFGSGFDGKRIPPELMQAPLPLIRELVRGLFHAGGCVNGNATFVQFSNRELAAQVHQLLQRLGYLFSIRSTVPASPGQRTYRVGAALSECPDLVRDLFGLEAPERRRLRYWFEADGLYWVRIESIDQAPYEGLVVDLEVEEDHSFVTAGVVVSNCFVIPSPEDSRGGILDNLKIMTEIMARAGGVGINLSTLRPRGSYIKTVNGTASGPCSWAELYSVATGDVIQQGGSRRGALMLMLNDDHPDIEEFITVKKDLTRINHANLSVCVSDAFMEAVKQDRPWNLVWQGEVKKTLRARDLWNLICESAWASGEPGLVFIDRYNKESNTYYYEKIICVNPCGEQGLPEWGVCNLGAMNLSAYVRGGLADEPGVFDYDALAADTRVAMRFLDNVVDATEYFFEENAQAQLGTRRTGLGTMGLADALIKLHVPYGSDESLPVIERIYRTIRDAAYDCSADLAVEKGPFPKFDAEKYAQGRFIRRLPEPIQEKIRAHGIRNAVLLTQAPTGTTSLLAGVSSGIEPVYDFALVRRDRTGEHVLYHPLLQAWKDRHPEAGLEDKPAWFVSANDLTPEEHVRVQALVQRYTDSSISKTVNAPNSHTVEQVQELYLKAYDYGCKGITYFRDGCREGVLSHIEEKPRAEAKPLETATEVPPPAAPAMPAAGAGAHAEPEAVQLGLSLGAVPEPGHNLKPRPHAAEGITYRMPTPLGTMFTTVTRNGGGQPFEVFLQVGKAGSDTAAMTEALGRLISLILRLPSPLSPAQRLSEVVDQLAGIGGGRQLGFGRNRVRSLPDAVAQVLDEFLRSAEEGAGAAPSLLARQPTLESASVPGAPVANGTARKLKADLCPECGDAALVYEEGCQKCYSCGYSEC